MPPMYFPDSRAFLETLLPDSFLIVVLKSMQGPLIWAVSHRQARERCPIPESRPLLTVFQELSSVLTAGRELALIHSTAA